MEVEADAREEGERRKKDRQAQREGEGKREFESVCVCVCVCGTWACWAPCGLIIRSWHAGNQGAMAGRLLFPRSCTLP